MPLHLTKIAFGAASTEDLRQWLEAHAGPAGGEARLHTRNLPTRAAELQGGSLYWIYGHRLIGRSPLLGFARAEDGRWAIRLEPRLIATEQMPRRAHQGWRYLTQEDAPPDLPAGALADDEAMPGGLVNELSRLGLI